MQTETLEPYKNTTMHCELWQLKRDSRPKAQSMFFNKNLGVEILFFLTPKIKVEFYYFRCGFYTKYFYLQISLKKYTEPLRINGHICVCGGSVKTVRIHLKFTESDYYVFLQE